MNNEMNQVCDRAAADIDNTSETAASTPQVSPPAPVAAPNNINNPLENHAAESGGKNAATTTTTTIKGMLLRANSSSCSSLENSFRLSSSTSDMKRRAAMLVAPRTADDEDEENGCLACIPVKELTALKRYFVQSLTKLYGLFREMNYIIVVLAWSIFITLVFAGIICGIAPLNADGNAISYLDALFFSVSAYTASGLTIAEYWSWGPAKLAFIGFMITSGSIVLLTTLPAVLRYRSLRVERLKLLERLEEMDRTPDEALFARGRDGGGDNANISAFRDGNGGGGGLPLPNAVNATSANDNSSCGAALDSDNASLQTAILSSPASDRSPMRAVAAAAAATSTVRKRVNTILYAAPLTRDDASPDHRAQFVAPASDVVDPAQVAAGQRIIYEDGLAHVNQQIDICLFIICGCVFYWFSVHLIFTLLLVAAGQDFGASLFHIISAFNNAGFSTNADSFVSIVKEPAADFIYFVVTVCMPLGNSLFPLCFRLMMTGVLMILESPMCARCFPLGEEGGAEQERCLFGQPVSVWAHNLRVFLRSPRRYYTHLFSWRNTLLLTSIWFFLTAIGTVLLVPEMDCSDCLHPDAKPHNKFWIALFQSVSVRSTGFNSLYLDKVSVAHDAWWVFAQFAAAYPFILISSSSGGSAAAARRRKKKTTTPARRTGSSSSLNLHDVPYVNKSEANAEGENDDDDDDDNDDDGVEVADEEADAELYHEQQKSDDKNIPVSRPTKATNIIARDMLILYTCLLFIMYLEQDRAADLADGISEKTKTRTHNNKTTNATSLSGSDLGIAMSGLYLRTAFELTSAFGNVGLAVGLKTNLCLTASFKNGFAVFLVIFVMYFGKHRGLPRSVDDAITIKVRVFDLSKHVEDDQLGKLSEEELQKRMQRLRRKVVNFYEYYNPIRLNRVDEILAAFSNNHGALMRNLEVTWGAAPPKKLREPLQQNDNKQ